MKNLFRFSQSLVSGILMSITFLPYAFSEQRQEISQSISTAQQYAYYSYYGPGHYYHPYYMMPYHMMPYHPYYHYYYRPAYYRDYDEDYPYMGHYQYYHYYRQYHPYRYYDYYY